MRRRVSFMSPGPNIYPNHGAAASAKSGENKKGWSKMWTFNGSRFSPARLLRQIGTKVEVTLWFLSSRKVSSATFAKSRSYAEKVVDRQRAEAVEDCIDFFNSFSSLQRSSSVTSTC